MGGRLSQRQPDEEVLLESKLKQNQPLNAQEGNHTERNTLKKLTEDDVVSRLERLAFLIERENEVSEEFQDLVRSTPQYEVIYTCVL